MKQLDDLDLKIIKILAKNSRESFRKIAKELGVGTDTISERYKRMKDNNIIKASLKVDLVKLGYHVHAWYWISLSSKTSIINIMDKLMKIPDMISFHKAIGNYDVLAVVAVRDFDHLDKIDKMIADLKGISKITSAQYILKGNITEFPLPPSEHFLEHMSQQ